jgi:hypothetical protein
MQKGAKESRKLFEKKTFRISEGKTYCLRRCDGYGFWTSFKILIYEVRSKTNETFVVVAHSRIGEVC